MEIPTRQMWLGRSMRLAVPLALLLLLLPSAGPGASVPRLSFREYLRTVLAVDPLVRTAANQKAAAEAERLAETDWYRNALTLGTSQQDIGMTGFTSSQALWSLNFTQGLGAIGAEAQVGATGPFPGLEAGPSEKLTIKWSQSIFPNFLGSISRRQREAAEALVESRNWAVKNQIAKTCWNSFAAYLELLQLQEEDQLLSAIQEGSARIRRTIESGVKRRLFPRIDLLTAQKDQLLTDDLRIELETKRELLWANATGGGRIEGLPTALPPLEPVTAFMDSARSLAAPATSTETLETREKKEATRSESSRVASVREEVRSPLDLLVERDTHWLVGLTLTVPFLDGQRDAKIRRQVVALTDAEIALEQSRRRDAENQIAARQQELQAEKLLSSSRKKAELAENILKEGERLFRAGKLELTELLRYRDQYLKEKKSLIQHEKDLWLAEVKKISRLTSFAELCEKAP